MVAPGGSSSTDSAAPPRAAQPAARKSGGLFSADPNDHLFDRLATNVKHWRAAVAMTVLVIAAMMYQTFTTVPLYRAQARVQIDEEQTTAQTDFRESSFVYSDPEPYYQTQYKILQGRDLALRAARRLKLDTVPEFNGRGVQPPLLTRLIGAVKAKIMEPFVGCNTFPASR
jgi:uncharacterized protein involved in exopolysaccharide biosynthesis